MGSEVFFSPADNEHGISKNRPSAEGTEKVR